MERNYFEKVGGERCYLSPIRVEDASQYVKWLNDPEIAINLTLLQQIITLPAEREHLERMARANEAFAIVVRGDGGEKPDHLIGTCGLHRVNHIDRTAECGIFIGDKHNWNRGYGTEALRLLMEFAFGVQNLRNVLLTVFEFNRRAIRCYEKVGFRELGRRRKARTVGGNSYDVVYMDLIAEEFSGESYIRRILEA